MWDLIVSVPDHCLSFYFALNTGLGGVRDVVSANISQEQTQSHRVCCFKIFSKGLLSDSLVQV